MAQETKVTLVAGLGFIICFTLVLTNRGRAPRIATPALDLTAAEVVTLAGGVSLPEAAQATPAPLPTQSRQDVGDWDMPADRPPSAPRSDFVDPDVEDTVGRTNTDVDGADDVTPTVGDPAAMAAGQTGGGNVADDQAALPSGVISAPARDEAQPPPAISQGDREELERLLSHIPTPAQNADRTRAADISPREQPSRRSFFGDGPVSDQPTPDAPGAGPRYVVCKGDTLYRIASSVYGSKSGEVVSAIYEANRAVMASPDELRIGQELVLPSIPGMDAPRAAASSPSRTDTPGRRPETDQPASTGTLATRWYQIKKNDRYVSIAREQLGEAGRWREIYELNKDMFPEPDKIRDGVSIRIPVVNVADARE